jgi:integrase/recombinase XerD
MWESAEPSASPSAPDLDVRQPHLFDLEITPVAVPSRRPMVPLVRAPLPAPDATLGACALPYEEYLRQTDHTANTVACFLSDLRLLITSLGAEKPIRSVTSAELEDWLRTGQHRRVLRGGAPTNAPTNAPTSAGANDERASPKTVARRLTFLKNFFGWLVAREILRVSPADGVRRARPLPPLPTLLFEDEVARLVAASAADVRSELLVSTLLEAGLKKEELLALRLADVDRSDPQRPAIEVHFPGQDKRRRERRMALPAEWAPIYQRYLERHRPVERVFECTGRNLNYVLAAAVRRAGLRKAVTLQLLRDVYAVRQLRAGVPPDALREKLGLSEEAWYESAEKYRKLALAL